MRQAVRSCRPIPIGGRSQGAVPEDRAEFPAEVLRVAAAVPCRPRFGALSLENGSVYDVWSLPAHASTGTVCLYAQGRLLSLCKKRNEKVKKYSCVRRELRTL